MCPSSSIAVAVTQWVEVLLEQECLGQVSAPTVTRSRANGHMYISGLEKPKHDFRLLCCFH